MRTRFLAAARAVDRLADAAGTEAEMAEVMKVLQFREELQIATTLQALNSGAHRPAGTRLPFRDQGDDFGRVEARIPKNLFFGLMHQKNFGHDGFCSDEGMRDFGKAFPQFMVKTVSGRTVVGYGGKSSRKPRVKFGRGTIQLAA